VITYVDTSTLIKLIVEEPGSALAEQIWQSADALAAVRLIEVEARAALGAARRNGRLTTARHRRSVEVLKELLRQLDIVEITADLIAVAARLAETHALRGYDAVHLAGAVLVGADALMSADTMLCDAASAEGIAVANPLGRP
jgi:predicted nucleic acid-binding protein